MTPEDATACAVRLSTAFRVTLTVPEIDVWVDHLADLDADLGVAAVHRIIDREKFFPTVATFRDAYRVEARRRLAVEPRRNEWGEVTGDIADVIADRRELGQ